MYCTLSHYWLSYIVPLLGIVLSLRLVNSSLFFKQSSSRNSFLILSVNLLALQHSPSSICSGQENTGYAETATNSNIYKEHPNTFYPDLPVVNILPLHALNLHNMWFFVPKYFGVYVLRLEVSYITGVQLSCSQVYTNTILQKKFFLRYLNLLLMLTFLLTQEPGQVPAQQSCCHPSLVVWSPSSKVIAQCLPPIVLISGLSLRISPPIWESYLGKATSMSASHISLWGMGFCVLHLHFPQAGMLIGQSCYRSEGISSMVLTLFHDF